MVILGSWMTSYLLGEKFSVFVSLSVTSWLVLDRILVENSVFEERVNKLQNNNALLEQKILLLKLDVERRKIDIIKKNTLRGSSCRF
jgi:hypothetical protein